MQKSHPPCNVANSFADRQLQIEYNIDTPHLYSPPNLLRSLKNTNKEIIHLLFKSTDHEYIALYMQQRSQKLLISLKHLLLTVVLRHEVEHDWVRQVRCLIHRTVSSSWELNEVLTKKIDADRGRYKLSPREPKRAMANITQPFPSPTPLRESRAPVYAKKVVAGLGQNSRVPRVEFSPQRSRSLRKPCPVLLAPTDLDPPRRPARGR